MSQGKERQLAKNISLQENNTQIANQREEYLKNLDKRVNDIIEETQKRLNNFKKRVVSSTQTIKQLKKVNNQMRMIQQRMMELKAKKQKINSQSASQSSQYLNEKIIFEDNFQRKMNQFPHSTIGAIQFCNKEKKTMIGTGVLISPNLVLTVAHNIYCRQQRESYSNIKFYPGLCGKVLQCFEIQSFYFPKKFVETNEPALDYGLLKLRKEVSAPKFMGLSENLGEMKTDFDVAIYGYSQDEFNRHSLQGIYQKGMIKGKEAIEEINEDKIYHRISTFCGQSGAPILSIDKAGDISIVGIHNGACKDKQRDSVNVGRLITKELIQTLSKEAMKMGACLFENSICDKFTVIEEEQLTQDSQKQQDSRRASKIKYPESAWTTNNKDKVCFFGNEPYQVPKQQMNRAQFKSLGAIICQDKQIRLFGTAFLISPNCIITSAHNVVNHHLNQNIIIKDIRFYPVTFGNLGLGIKINNVSVCEEYLKGGKDVIYDFAFCLLENEVNIDRCIEFGYNFESKNSSIAQSLSIFGYPAQNYIKQASHYFDNGYSVSLRGLRVSNQTFYKYIKSTDLKRGIIKHLISTKPGQGGAPIMAEINGRMVAIGLVKGGKYSKDRQKLYNVGLLFNKYFIRKMREFIEEHHINTIPFQTLNINLLTLNNQFWCNEQTSEMRTFETKDGLVLRNSSLKNEICQIRSINLRNRLLYCSQNVMTLRLANFHFEEEDNEIQFGVMIQKKDDQENVIKYLINQNDVKTIQFIDVTIDLFRGEISFAPDSKEIKPTRKDYIPLMKKPCEIATLFFFTKMKSEGCSFEVAPKVIEQFRT